MKTRRLARSLLGGGLTAVLSVSPLGAASDLPLIQAVRNQDLAAARALVDGGDTALHGAASHGMDTVVRYLAEQGADVNARNQRRQTPLDVAVYSRERFERTSTVTLLRSLGGTEGAPPPIGRR